MKTAKLMKILLSLFIFAISFGLAGCLNAESSIDVNDNSSAVINLLIGLLVTGAIVGAIVLFLRKTRKPAPRNAVKNNVTDDSPAEAESVVLNELGIEVLFNQVNQKVLNHRGNIHRSAADILLFWESTPGHHKFIGIKDVGQGQISINGMIVPATKENAKEGILKVLKEQ